MKHFSELLAALANTPHPAARKTWLTEYVAAQAASENWADLGFAIGWLIGSIKPPRLTPAKQLALAHGVVDEQLLQLSAASIGDGAEATALIWPGSGNLSLSEVVRGVADPAANFDNLDTPARVALSNLYAGRKVKGVRFEEVLAALAAIIQGDPKLVAGALAAEQPPYPGLTKWLAGGGAPAYHLPSPPRLKVADQVAPNAAHWPLPPGDAAAYENNVAFSADGQVISTKTPAGSGWGFLHKGAFTTFSPPPAPFTREQANAHFGSLLQLENGEWSIVRSRRKLVACSVLYVEIGRQVSLTAAISINGENAPLAKVTCPAAAAPEVVKFARRNTLEKFGPVRRVGPGLSLTLSFAGVSNAPRRKCGLSLIDPQADSIQWTEVQPLTIDALHETLRQSTATLP